MKWLLIPTFLLLAGACWLNGRFERQSREITRLQQAVDSLEQVVFVRQWVDRNNFNRLITNVQLLNMNAIVRQPQLKARIDQHEEYWQLWQSE